MYAGTVFGEVTEDEEDARETEEDREARLAEEAKHADDARRKSWFSMAYQLATGDVTRMADVLGTPAHLCFTHLAFEKTNKKVAAWVKGR
jgi:hypothetical protein